MNGIISNKCLFEKIIQFCYKMVLCTYLWANDPVNNELNKMIVSSKSQMKTLSTVLSTSSGLPPFWLFLLVLQLLFPALIVPPFPELRFLESFFRAEIVIKWTRLFNFRIYACNLEHFKITHNPRLFLQQDTFQWEYETFWVVIATLCDKIGN